MAKDVGNSAEEVMLNCRCPLKLNEYFKGVDEEIRLGDPCGEKRPSFNQKNYQIKYKPRLSVGERNLRDWWLGDPGLLGKYPC